MTQVSLFHLYALRILYLLMAVALGAMIWPVILHPTQPLGVGRSVANAMLGAISALSFLGLRYPLKMLPLLFFEIVWKLVWLMFVAYPAYRNQSLDENMLSALYEILPILIFPFLLPWRYIFDTYLAGSGDRWR